MESIKVFAPATVANVSCGFDVLGFAVEQPGDELVLRKSNSNRIEIVEITGDNGKLPRNPTENTATVAIQKFLEKLEISQGLEVSLYKKMPLGSGMGSSAASAVAGVFAVNKLLGEPLSVAELLPFAMEGERIACGAAHADNVAPSLYGGLVLIRSYEPLDVVRVPMPKDLFCVLMHPHIHIRTEDARAILKRQVPMQKAIQQSGNLAGLILGFTQSDYGLISRSMQDVIVEPVRSILIPGFHAIKKAALENGALGFSISGSGPSMFALCKGKEIADRVGEVMKSSLESLEIDSEIFISEVNLDGPKVI
ncbi:MAG: homoserine kinase [Flammeovirgaceae bacterium]|jgi:homoserine kinase